MGATEGVAAEHVHEIPDGGRLRLAASIAACALFKLEAHLFDFGVAHFHQCPAKDIRPSRRHGSESFCDLEDVLLIGDDAMRAPQHRLQRRVGVFGLFEAQGPAGKCGFAERVGGSGADHRYNGDEGVDVAAGAHFRQIRHGGALDVVHPPGVAGGNHFPHRVVIPWACEAG